MVEALLPVMQFENWETQTQLTQQTDRAVLTQRGPLVRFDGKLVHT
jgi:hypothetical protein